MRSRAGPTCWPIRSENESRGLAEGRVSRIDRKLRSRRARLPQSRNEVRVLGRVQALLEDRLHRRFVAPDQGGRGERQRPGPTRTFRGLNDAVIRRTVLLPGGDRPVDRRRERERPLVEHRPQKVFEAKPLGEGIATLLVIDGQVQVPLRCGDRVTIRAADPLPHGPPAGPQLLSHPLRKLGWDAWPRRRATCSPEPDRVSQGSVKSG